MIQSFTLLIFLYTTWNFNFNFVFYGFISKNNVYLGLQKSSWFQPVNWWAGGCTGNACQRFSFYILYTWQIYVNMRS